MSLIYLLIGLVLLAILVGAIWNFFHVGELFATMTRTQRLLFALLGLLLIVLLVWVFFSRIMPMGGLTF